MTTNDETMEPAAPGTDALGESIRTLRELAAEAWSYIADETSLKEARERDTLHDMLVDVVDRLEKVRRSTQPDRIAEVLAEHHNAGGCICGNAPEVFWDRDFRAHLAEAVAAEFNA
ncbi:MAG: hypothetical protein J0J04_07890 [Microbacterium sp.]|uniref:hypothetical protein n=1 Tax=Microbacterium sp. TaxID=51671 RepID=UPI001AC04739|nr:hypothetical protein [Microbacterium sp.]MBN9214720.1 hypothetical protein [Microbacterium sp.]